MTPKKILIIIHGSLFPTVMMSQVRILNLVKGLSGDHTVDVASVCRDSREEELSRTHLKGMCNRFFPLKPINPRNALFVRKYYGLKHLLLNLLFGIHKIYATNSNKKIINRILDVVEAGGYDIVHVEYWYMAEVLGKIEPNVFKTIDSHGLVEEIVEFRTNMKAMSFFKKRELEKSKKLQERVFGYADFVISISEKGKRMISDLSLHDNCMVVPIAMDIDFFKDFPGVREDKTILFYGGMGSAQNITAFTRLWDHIFPLVKKKIPGVRLLVVGSHPPPFIKNLHNGEDVIVTGYVEDVREYISRAKIKILPMEMAVGFRGRSIEVMAMGIPIVGTHNALDCLEMDNELTELVTDDNLRMAELAVRLLTDAEFYEKMSARAVDFVSKTYSDKVVYKKLSDYYLSLPSVP